MPLSEVHSRSYLGDVLHVGLVEFDIGPRLKQVLNPSPSQDSRQA
jgi:hypothetical protein